MRISLLFQYFLLLSMLLPVHGSLASAVLTKWLGQTVYVPIYSDIHGDDRYRNMPFLLTATLSIRNADLKHPLTLKSVSYYDSEGHLLKQYMDKPFTLGPLASTRFVVPESEDKGGSGAKFLVEWEAGTAVVEPIIESVMIGTKMQQGISFISIGRVIQGTPAH